MQKRHSPATRTALSPAPTGRPITPGFATGSLLILAGFVLGPNVFGVIDGPAVSGFILTAASCAFLFYMGAKSRLVYGSDEQPLLHGDYARFIFVSAVVLIGLVGFGATLTEALILSALAGSAGVGLSLTVPPQGMQRGERHHALIALGGILLLPLAAGAGEPVLGLLREVLLSVGMGVLILLVGQYRFELLVRYFLRRLSPGSSLGLLAGVVFLLMVLFSYIGISLPLSAFLGGLLIRRCPFTVSVFVDALRLRAASRAGFLVVLGVLLEIYRINLVIGLAGGLFLLHVLASLFFARRVAADQGALRAELPGLPRLIALLWLFSLYRAGQAATTEWDLLFGIAAALVVASDLFARGFTSRRDSIGPTKRMSRFMSELRMRRRLPAGIENAHLIAGDLGATGLRLMEIVHGSTMDGARLRSISFWPEFRVYVHTVWRGDTVLEISDGLIVQAGDAVLLSGPPERLISLAPLFECSFINPEQEGNG